MWTVIKFNNNYSEILKQKLVEKLGEDTKFYLPKIKIKKLRKNKFVDKDLSLMGNYFFCFNDKFQDLKILRSLKYLKGINYFLAGYMNSQTEINNFISKCKEFEDDKGYVSHNFVKLCTEAKYKFISGPFFEMIFKIINLQKNSIKILLGNFETTIKKKEYFFTRV